MSRRPLRSLTWRVLWSLLAAFGVVFGVLFAVIAYRTLNEDSGEIDAAFVNAARSLVRALDGAQDAAALGAALTMIRAIESHSAASNGEGVPPMQVMAISLDGRIRDSAGAPAFDLAAIRDGAARVDLGGVVYRTYTATGARWKLVLADDVHARRAAVLRGVGADLAIYIALALPIVLVPVWWSARSGLRPLRRLSDEVAARRPDDMRPLAAPAAYRELAPLTGALNRLFERVAHGLAREKAFVHDAAHELRTPLAVVAAQAHLVATAEGETRAEAQRQLDAAVARASHQVQQLLRLARADALDATARAPVALMDLARETLAGFAPAATAAGVELSLQGPDRLDVVADAPALRSALENLVDNALRYAAGGGVVEVDVQANAEGVRLRVADRGPGIAADERERVFERFHRGRGVSAPGAGLGLAIVRESVQALGGRVHVEDRPDGPGCVVVIELSRGLQVLQS